VNSSNRRAGRCRCLPRSFHPETVYFALTVSTGGLACATYSSMPPRNPLVSLSEQKNPRLRIGNQCTIRPGFRTETTQFPSGNGLFCPDGVNLRILSRHPSSPTTALRLFLPSLLCRKATCGAYFSPCLEESANCPKMRITGHEMTFNKLCDSAGRMLVMAPVTIPCGELARLSDAAVELSGGLTSLRK
jgi:hypothetical protein